MTRILLLLAALLTGAWIHGSASTAWYVNSSTGNDSNTGRSSSQAFATLQKAADSTHAGDTVNITGSFGGGSSGVAPLLISTSGSGPIAGGSRCALPITYQTDPSSVSRAVVTSSQGFGTVQMGSPISCIVINNLELAGPNSSITWGGASLNAGDVSWFTSGLYNGSGIYVTGAVGNLPTTSPHHLTFTNNYIHDYPLNGIGVSYGDYITITGNVFRGNSLYSPFAGSCASIYELHNIDATTGTKDVVSGNMGSGCINLVPNNNAGAVKIVTTATTFSGTNQLSFTAGDVATTNFTQAAVHVSGTPCIPTGTTIFFFPSSTSIALSQNTTCQINSGQTILFGYITDGEGVIIDNNTNTQSDSVPYVGRTLVSNNLLVGNGNSCIEAGPLSINVDMTFNSCYDNQVSFNTTSAFGAAQSELNINGGRGMNVVNNLFQTSSLVPSGWDQSAGTSTYANNGFFGGSGAHPLPGTGNVTSDPFFLNPVATLTQTTIAGGNNFTLQTGSPAIGAGSATFTHATDILGNVGLNDLGAYSYYVATNCFHYPASPVYQSLDLAGWGTLNATLATNQLIGPSCGQTAATLTEDSTATASHQTNQSTSVAVTARPYTYTIWAKRTVGTRNVMPWTYSSGFGGNAEVGVDLGTCAINVAATAGGGWSAPSAVATLVGSYCKIALTFTPTVDTSIYLFAYMMNGASGGSGSAPTYSGNGTSQIALWGADLR